MKILFTIDAEVGDSYLFRKEAFDFMVMGGPSGSGLPVILKFLKAYGITGHFFVDIYSNEFYGHHFDGVVENILESGSKAYLHAHPAGRFDKNRPYIHQYNESEQEHIIDWGVEEWKRITGGHPLGFRAGSHSANDVTLRLLKAKGFNFDSSYFVGGKECKIEDQSILKQIPINHLQAQYLFLGMKKNKIVKIDINWMPIDVIKTLIVKYKNVDGYIMVFLHSFSFMNLYSKKVRKEKVNDFEDLLKLIQSEGVECVENMAEEDLQPISILETVSIPIGTKDLANYFLSKQM